MNRGDELNCRLPDEAHTGRLIVVKQPSRDALGQPMHLGPGATVPR